MTIERIRVASRAGSYDVLCGSGVLARAAQELARIAKTSAIFVVSSPRVWKHCGKTVRRYISGIGAKSILLLEDRESAKSLHTVERTCRDLIRAGADRNARIVAVGGGVVGDVAGFVAAAYLRGISLVHIPTTLVAQVDSAVGGKTGVNLPEGKNLVGAFFPPKLVLVDPGMLRTLPDREYRSGLYEVIKYGVIADAALFAYLEENLDALLRRDAKALQDVIARSLRVKARVVSKDERESGLREILNFGHTFGHALESVTRYRRFLHGEAIAYGMIAATALSESACNLDAGDVARIVRLVLRVGPLPKLPNISASKLIAAMRRDKKARDGRLRFVLTRRIGSASGGHPADDAAVSRAWNRVARDTLIAWTSGATK
jgi:3-dehydroquinate synthase